MDDHMKLRLVTSIMHFLRRELRSGTLNSENAEGLEVAIQCLESIYDVHDGPQVDPPLDDIFKEYLTTSVLNKPDASEEDKGVAERLKREGNNAMNADCYNEALDLYSRAIALDCKNAVYYCNRAAAHSKLRNHKQAIADCKLAIEIDPSYSKAYGRLGLAYCGLEDYEKALENYKKALDLEPTNEGYKKNYELAQARVRESRQATTTTGGTNSAETFTDPLSARPINPSQLIAAFGNPQLLNIVTRMLADPNLQNMMALFLADQMGGGDGAQEPAQPQQPQQQPQPPRQQQSSSTTQLPPADSQQTRCDCDGESAASNRPPNRDASVGPGTIEDLVNTGRQWAEVMRLGNPQLYEEFLAAFPQNTQNNSPNNSTNNPADGPDDKKNL